VPKIARVACVVAFAMGGFDVISALRGQIILLPLASFPLLAGIGILRKQAWSAYGLALLLLGQLLLIPLLTIRAGSPAGWLPEVAAGVAMSVVLIPLFFFAGRSLGRLQLKRGWAWPWIAALVALTLPLFFFQAFKIPTGAMEDTLLIGDRILAQRFPRPSPTHGDIVAFVYPVDRSQTLVKRVIGIPGDHIRILGKVVYRNGAALQEPYAAHKAGFVDPYRDNFPAEPNVSIEQGAVEMLRDDVVNGEVVVPAGKYFVLGDNRDYSWDSRYWGFIGLGDLIGKPVMIYDSEEPPAEGAPNASSGGSRRIRWQRLFKLL
jgi:signal peptidase I